MYFIGLDVHKKTISYCVKDAAGRVYQEGKIGSTRWELDEWIRTMPQPRTIAMEATIFTGWIYDHLLPHAEKVKVAHPLMLRAIAAAKKKSDRIDAGKIADCLRCDFLPECHMASTEIRDRRRTLRYRLVIRQMVQMKNRVSGLPQAHAPGVRWTRKVRTSRIHRTDYWKGGHRCLVSDSSGFGNHDAYKLPGPGGFLVWDGNQGSRPPNYPWTYHDKLPISVDEIRRNRDAARGISCDYCFFGGPTKKTLRHDFPFDL